MTVSESLSLLLEVKEKRICCIGCAPIPFGHQSCGSFIVCFSKETIFFSKGFKTTVWVIFFPPNSATAVPCKVCCVTFSNSTVVSRKAGACFLSSGFLTPGTLVTTYGCCTLTSPVVVMETSSQIPVLRSRTGWIQSHPGVYCMVQLRAICASPP